MNQSGSNREASRRWFLRGGARYALLAALGAVSVALFKRSGGKLAGQTCINQGICPGCGAFADCGLPPALSAKDFHSRARVSRGAATPTEGPKRQGIAAASVSDVRGRS